MSMRTWIGPSLLLSVIGTGGGLAAWKHGAILESEARAASNPAPMESVTVAVAEEREYRKTTTAIGTVLAMRSVTLRNELSGTVSAVALTVGQVVEAGAVLVALDVSVEEAELRALEAQASLAETMLGRMQRASQNRAASELDVDKARAERDIALAQVERTKAIIARKVIRAPFRARVGLADLHVGQYLHEGTELTTLQGVDDAVHVDFTVAQRVAAGLQPGQRVDVFASGKEAGPIPATIVAVDARIDRTTRNAMVRAKIEDAERAPAPGASVHVHVPTGAPRAIVAVPASALRRGPAGDHVFVILADDAGRQRAHQRRVISGAMIGDEVAIEDGLATGDRVAASGSFKLYDRALVALAESAAPADGAGH